MKGRILVAAVLGFAYLPMVSAEKAAPIFNERSLVHPVVGDGGMVVAQERLAAEAGVEVLRRGGNAVDAAVTTGFALAVTLPRAGNIGGGGFMIVHRAGGESFTIDFREMAPAGSEVSKFTKEDGLPDPKKTRSAATATGVPGTVRGFAMALRKAGTITIKEALEPAIRMANEGIPVNEDLHDSLKAYRKAFEISPASMAVFYPDGKVPEVGANWKQADLASTLRRISDGGADEFYQGETAEVIARYMKEDGGIMTAEDLAGYRAVERKPLEGSYRGVKILTMPPPSAGGATLLQMLGMLESFSFKDTGARSAGTLHLLTEVMKLAYANRSKGFGDPDFVKVPLDVLLAEDTARAQVTRIDPDKATSSSEIRPFLEDSEKGESRETTHFSVVDKWGNAVSVTYTLNFSYGSKRMVPGTGILLNNEMDDFNVVPGVPNAYGLPADEANGLASGKRMLSSMTPVIAFFPDGAVLVTGSPGGGRIPNAVLQVLSNVIDHGMNIAEATHAPRIHHQWQPDTLWHERGFSPDTLTLLRKRGHKLSPQPAMGSTQTVLWKDGVFYGSADPRRRGAAAVPVK